MIELRLEGTEKVILRLEKIVANLENMKPVFEEIGTEMMKDFEANMESSNKRRSFGGSWAPLSSRTLEARAKRTGYYSNAGGGTKPLIWTGKLKRGFEKVEVAKDHVTVGNEVKYYPYHQLGTRSIPQRRMIGLEKKLIGNIVQIIQKSIIDSING